MIAHAQHDLTFEDEMPDETFEFVDAHHHLWDLTKLHYGWLTDKPFEGHPSGDYSAIKKNFLVSDLKAAGRAVNLIKSVHIETADGELDPVRETAWLQSVADVEGMPNAIIARTDLMHSNAASQLDRNMEYKNFRGIRMLSFTGPDFFDDPDFVQGFAELSKRDLIFDMDADAKQMRKAHKLAAQFPDGRIVLGHCGFPKERTIAYFHHWRKELFHLATAPNVACKLSGLLMVDHAWSVDSIRPWIETCIEAFGPERCMFGTNWPLDGLYSDYTTLVTAYRTITADFSASERQALFRKSAENWYRI